MYVYCGHIEKANTNIYMQCMYRSGMQSSIQCLYVFVYMCANYDRILCISVEFLPMTGFFFIIAVLMVIVFSIRLWPIAKFVFWNCHCGAYCVTCDSNQNGAEQNKTYSKRCSHTKLNQRNTHTHTLHGRSTCRSLFSNFALFLQLYLTTNQRVATQLQVF